MPTQWTLRAAYGTSPSLSIRRESPQSSKAQRLPYIPFENGGKQLVCRARRELRDQDEENFLSFVLCSWHKDDLVEPYALAIGSSPGRDLNTALDLSFGEVEDLLGSAFEAVLIAQKGSFRLNPKYLQERANFLGMTEDVGSGLIGLNGCSGCDGGPIEGVGLNKIARGVIDGKVVFSTRDINIQVTDSGAATWTRGKKGAEGTPLMAI